MPQCDVLKLDACAAILSEWNAVHGLRPELLTIPGIQVISCWDVSTKSVAKWPEASFTVNHPGAHVCSRYKYIYIYIPTITTQKLPTYIYIYKYNIYIYIIYYICVSRLSDIYTGMHVIIDWGFLLCGASYQGPGFWGKECHYQDAGTNGIASWADVLSHSVSGYKVSRPLNYNGLGHHCLLLHVNWTCAMSHLYICVFIPSLKITLI